MSYFIGLDVSNKETSICIINETGKIVKEAKVKSDPDAIHKFLSKFNYNYEKIGLEAGGLSIWLVKGIKKLGYKVICIDSRKMAAIISVKVNKTDKNDAREIANAMRCNNYIEVHMKSDESVRANALLTTRKALVETKLSLENTVRGMLKNYGIKLKRNIKSYPTEVRSINGNSFDQFMPEGKPTIDLRIFEPILKTLEEITKQLDGLEVELEAIAKQDKVCKRLMTMDGVGPIIALAYKCEIDDPTRFTKSRSVGAYLGITPKQYSSGEKVIQGRISRCGSTEVRSLLILGANVTLNKCKKKSSLKTWALKKKRQLGNAKAKVALARQMAVRMHRMWINEKDFDRQIPENYHCPEEKKLNEKKEIRKEHLLLKKMKEANKQKFVNVA